MSVVVGSIVEPYGTTHTVMAPPGKLGLMFSRAFNGVGIMCQPVADSVLKDKVTSRMMLVSVDGINVADLDQYDISEMLNSRADKERKLNFVIDAADSANKQTKTVAVKNCSVKRVVAPGGRLGFAMCVAKKGEHKFTEAATKFNAPADGLYGRIIPDAVAPPSDPGRGCKSPLFKQLHMDVVQILAIEGTPASSLGSAEAATKCLTANADAQRTLVVQKLDGGGSPLRAVLEPTAAGTLKVTAIDTASPLLGHAAIGAEIVAVKGLDKPTVEGLASLPTTSIELTIKTLPISRCRMDSLLKVPVLAALQLATSASSADDTCFQAALPSQEEPRSHAACSLRGWAAAGRPPQRSLIFHVSTPRMEFISFIPLDSQNGKVTFASVFDAMQACGLSPPPASTSRVPPPPRAAPAAPLPRRPAAPPHPPMLSAGAARCARAGARRGRLARREQRRLRPLRVRPDDEGAHEHVPRRVGRVAPAYT